MVKTANGGRFPKAHFDFRFVDRKAVGAPRGDWQTLTSEHEVELGGKMIRLRTWHMRVVGTMFGVMVTNAYNLHKLECKDVHI